MIGGLSILDLITVGFFLVAWLGLAPFVVWRSKHLKAAAAMVDHRRAWMNAMLGREVREADAIICGNIMSSGSFFATCAIVVAGALLGILFNTEGTAAHPLGSDVSFPPLRPFEIKVMLVLTLALYAFVSFTWSIRQANYLNVVIGASPPAPVDPALRKQLAADMATIISRVAGSYDAGMRSYYFGLCAVGWIVSPWIFLAATATVVALLLRRQVHSTTALALAHLATAHVTTIHGNDGARTFALDASAKRRAQSAAPEADVVMAYRSRERFW